MDAESQVQDPSELGSPRTQQGLEPDHEKRQLDFGEMDEENTGEDFVDFGDVVPETFEDGKDLVPELVPPSQPIHVEGLLENQLDDELENIDPPKQPKSSEKHLENSRNWHKMWVKKGVPRVPKAAAKPKMVAKPKSKPSTGGSNGSNGPQPAAKNLAQAKDVFISKWIQSCGMEPSNERRAAAIHAWMNSIERSNFIAGQKGSQKWVIFWNTFGFWN